MNNYTLTATNLNNQRHLVNETTEQRIRRLRQSIADIRAAGGNPAAYERVLAKVLEQEAK